MSGSKRLVRVSQCAVSLIGVACLSVFANTERNGFIGVEGDAEFYKDGDDTIGIHNPIGAVGVVVETRDGWRFDDGTTTKNVVHKIGETNDFVVIGRDGESSTKNYLVDDVEHVHKSIASEEHTDDAAIEPESAPDEMILVYADPDYGAVVPSNGASWRIVQKATHTHTTQKFPCPVPGCPWGDGTSSETAEIGPELSGLVISCDVPGAKDGLLTFGTYSIGYYASWTNSFCCEDKCYAMAGTNSTISVFKLSVTNDPYIGLDMTDAGKDKYVVKNAKAKIEPTPSKGRYDVSYEWNTNPLCEIVEETKTRQEASYQNLSHKQASAAYQDQRLACTVMISSKESQDYGSASCTNNFTVVKVDVEIEMPDAKNAEENESIEETQGAYLYYIPDSNSWWTVEATNNLRKVKFRYWPEDLPKEQTVTIEADAELLYELKDRKYRPAKKNYTLKELGERDFVLHAHRRSEKYLGEEIRFTHDLSQAVDVAKYTIFGRPLLVPDYDRDGKIDEEDDARAQDGKTVFRFWINNDDDANYWDSLVDSVTSFELPNDYSEPKGNNAPRSGKNYDDKQVNGRMDMEDFTPVMADYSGVFPEGTPAPLINALELKIRSDCLNVVWTPMRRESVAQFLDPISDLKMCGASFDEYVHKAKVTKVMSWETIPQKVINDSSNTVFLVEGTAKGQLFEVKVEIGGKEISRNKLNINVSDVDEMYRWLDLRPTCNSDCKDTSRLDEPTNGPDKEINGLDRNDEHIVFVHGYNVNEESAAGWGATVFKRLWQAGSNARFTAVDWIGDETQDYIFGITANYYINVENAFKTARALVNAQNLIPGNKTYLGHSMGNMVVSAAITPLQPLNGEKRVDTLTYKRYYMLNAAVAQEAYNDCHYELDMQEAGWDGINQDKWSWAWHELFDCDKYDGDMRRRLTWKNRFGKIPNAINCYSATEDVLANIGNENKLGTSKLGGDWVKQELFKGCTVWRAANGIFPNHVNIEGGWGINSYYTVNPRYYLMGWGLITISINGLSNEQMIEHPVFTPLRKNKAQMHSLEPYKVTSFEVERELNNRFLADAIPAMSFAAGRNKISDMTNVEFVDLCGKDIWPRENFEWRHSDLKNIAYCYVKGLYKMIAVGKDSK